MGMAGMDEVSTRSTEGEGASTRKACVPHHGVDRIASMRVVLTCSALVSSVALCCVLAGCTQGNPSNAQPTVETVEVVLPATQGGPKTFTSNDLECTVELKAFHPVSEGEICYEYNLTITNPGSRLDEWSVDVPFSDDFSLVEGKRADYAVSGRALTVSSKDYNALFPAAGELSDLSFKVRGPESLVVAA